MTIPRLLQRLKAALHRAQRAEARVRELEKENATLRARVRSEGARRSALHDLSRHTF